MVSTQAQEAPVLRLISYVGKNRTFHSWGFVGGPRDMLPEETVRLPTCFGLFLNVLSRKHAVLILPQ